jgi:hypothetical protein
MTNELPGMGKVKRVALEGRVAQILNVKELVINIGTTHGVSLGMKFAILAETPIEVRDPATLEILDIIDREKVRVVASEVREKISICKTYRVKKISGGPGLDLGFLDLMRPRQEIPETLAAKDYDLPPPLDPEESYVKINDRIIQVIED